MRLSIRPEADHDLDQAADFYAREANVDVALRFLAAFDAVCTTLLQHPQSGTIVKVANPRLSGLRFCVVPGFESHLIFHISAPACVEVVRVLHGARDLARILEDDSTHE
ncbi:MAG: type II toxin-antitoxin system RelE/ParE family toxin [Planctomycetota bacterium]